MRSKNIFRRVCRELLTLLVVDLDSGGTTSVSRSGAHRRSFENIQKSPGLFLSTAITCDKRTAAALTTAQFEPTEAIVEQTGELAILQITKLSP